MWYIKIDTCLKGSTEDVLLIAVVGSLFIVFPFLVHLIVSRMESIRLGVHKTLPGGCGGPGVGGLVG